MDNPSQSITIILADDDADDRFFFRELLSEITFQIELKEYEDGDQLLNDLNALPDPPPPAIIFLDINMPRKTGIECLKDLRSTNKFCKIPIVMFTTSTNKKDIEETKACGANLFIRKAYSFQEGVDTLRGVLESYLKGELLDTPEDKFFVDSL